MSGRILMVVAGALGAVAGASAQSSPWYITDGDSGRGDTHVMQGGVQQFQYQWAGDAQIPIYVAGTVRQAVFYGNGSQGDEYSLGGTPTNVQNYWSSINGANSYDAGFDGKNVYMVDYNSGMVSMWDANYANGVNLFQANGGDIGITYDGANQTVWTCNFGSGTLTQWNPGNGQVVSSFQIPSQGYLSALAWDSIDNSLWLADAFANTGLQIDKNTGQIMQSIQLPEYVLGGEMPIPAPGAVALAGLGGIVAMRRRR